MLLRDFLRLLGILCRPQYDNSKEPDENQKNCLYSVNKNPKTKSTKNELEGIRHENIDTLKYFAYMLCRFEIGSNGMITCCLG
jgi:hypothetical protein